MVGEEKSHFNTLWGEWDYLQECMSQEMQVRGLEWAQNY